MIMGRKILDRRFRRPASDAGLSQSFLEIASIPSPARPRRPCRSQPHSQPGERRQGFAAQQQHRQDHPIAADEPVLLRPQRRWRGPRGVPGRTIGASSPSPSQSPPRSAAAAKNNAATRDDGPSTSTPVAPCDCPPNADETNNRADGAHRTARDERQKHQK